VYTEASIETLCGLFGKSRQAYYKWHPRELRHAAMETIALEQTCKIREEAPGMGSYKIYLMLVDIFGRDNMMGRDAFFRLLQENGLTLPRRKGRRTTHSFHHFHKWSNLIKGFEPDAPNRLWVSDITYIVLSDGGVCYLHLVTDVYSRKIVGWCLSSTLHASHSLEALDMAIAAAVERGDDLSQLIHHSDRGIQYCSHLYVGRLNALGASISMTEDGNPTDNAIAERVNGIVKNEYLTSRGFSDIMEAYSAISRAIGHYNNVRPHMSLGYVTPAMVYDEPCRKGVRAWKKRRYGDANAASVAT
jgi:transposase InsO family protein